MFSTNNNTLYWYKIDKLVDDYNNTRHSSIKMKPVEASKKENEEKVFANLYGDLIYLKSKKPKFAIGNVFQSTRGEYLIRVTHQTGQKRYS